MCDDTKRLFLWAVPRSISTAFFRAMMHRQRTKVLLEPFSRAYYYGPERQSKRYADQPVQPADSYEAVMRDVEQKYDDCDTVFVKDMAYYFTNRLHSVDALPKNFIHTFLLRDPQKSVCSLYKMSLNKDLTGWSSFDPSEVGFTELYQVYKLVTEELGQPAIVIDADDLLKNPEAMLRLYCEKVGIEFQDSMINWNEQPQDMAIFKDWQSWFEGVLTSSTFQPSSTKPKSPMVMPDLPRHVQKCIDDSRQLYKHMYDVRLTLNTLQN